MEDIEFTWEGNKVDIIQSLNVVSVSTLGREKCAENQKEIFLDVCLNNELVDDAEVHPTLQC